MFRKDSLNRRLPTGRSKKRKRQGPGVRRWLGLVTLLTAALVCFVPASQAQTVDVTVDIDGVAMPGASLTATANIDIQDGSTLVSISWTLTGRGIDQPGGREPHHGDPGSRERLQG
jgi:hypothetical protein